MFFITDKKRHRASAIFDRHEAEKNAKLSQSVRIFNWQACVAYCCDLAYTIHIYDIKHKVALLVKEVLEADMAWASFIEFASIAQSYMRQSDVAALALGW